MKYLEKKAGSFLCKERDWHRAYYDDDWEGSDVIPAELTKLIARDNLNANIWR